MSDFGKKTQSENNHLANLTSARFVTLDGTTTPGTVVPATKGCRILRVSVLSKGVALTIRSGTRQVAVITTTTVENTYWLGEYLSDGLTIDGVSGTGSVNIAYDV